VRATEFLCAYHVDLSVRATSKESYPKRTQPDLHKNMARLGEIPCTDQPIKSLFYPANTLHRICCGIMKYVKGSSRHGVDFSSQQTAS
jgi:uncharacterized protein YqjF (DUF2071 family)